MPFTLGRRSRPADLGISRGRIDGGKGCYQRNRKGLRRRAATTDFTYSALRIRNHFLKRFRVSLRHQQNAVIERFVQGR
jgi:hypothetical protein